MIDLFLQPETWAALLALTAMEIVLGVDNLVFITIATNKLPDEQQRRLARRIGIGLALGLRLVLLGAIAWIAGLTAIVFDLGIAGSAGLHGEPTFETAFSWRDLILISGGAFLVWKATSEIHHKVDPKPAPSIFKPSGAGRAFASVIAQIIVLDAVFSVDSILTAIGMTTHLPIMIVAVIIAVIVMYAAAGPLSLFVSKNPTVIMLALAFLLMIGMVLIADGFGRHVPKGYIYAAMAFSVLVEGLNILARRRSARSANAQVEGPTS